MEQLEMTVGHLTGDEVVSVEAGASLSAVADLLAGADIGAVAVVLDGRPAGIVSERDIVRAVAAGADFETVTAGEAASRELVWTDAGASIEDVAGEMMDKWVRHVLVEADGELVGIVSARDLLGALAARSAADD